MSSERNGGRWTFCCDTCGEVIDTDDNDFNSALSFAKGEGWRACPECKEARE